MLDYIIVGSGLAGIAFSEIALQNNKTILTLKLLVKSDFILK